MRSQPYTSDPSWLYTLRFDTIAVTPRLQILSRGSRSEHSDVAGVAITDIYRAKSLYTDARCRWRMGMRAHAGFWRFSSELECSRKKRKLELNLESFLCAVC